MWRIYPQYFDRRWRFQGRCHDGKIRAYYWADRGNGGEGDMKLYLVLRSNYLGGFQEERASEFRIGPSYIDFAAPIEWIRVDSDDEPAVVTRLREIPVAQVTSYLPRRVCRRLQDKLSDASVGQRVLRALAFGSCLQGDMSGPLANEVERLRQAARNSEQQPPQEPDAD
jgi:hypothetical protein